jgi:SHS2 domain-containing protein
VTVEFLEHTADVAVRVTGASERELLEEAARALLEVLIDAEESQKVEEEEAHLVEVEAEDGESLLIRLLGELIFLFDSRQFLCGRLEIEDVTFGPPTRLKATARGEALDPARHVFLTEVKAATYHDLSIRRRAGSLEAVIVFDV